MSLPVLLHSGLQGAPALNCNSNGSFNALLLAALVNGFNTQSVSSATASGGVVTFNYASAPGFPVGYTIEVSGASNASINGRKRVTVAAGNQVSFEVTGVPDGAVGGTIITKFASLGWTRPYNSGTTVGAYQQGGAATHKRWLRVYDATLASTGNVYVRAYEAMTAISTGTGPFPTTGEVSGNGADHSVGSMAARPWIIIGTPRAFYLCTDYNADYSALPAPVFTTGQTQYPSSLFFGEMDRIQKAGDTYAYYLSKGSQGTEIWGSRASTLAANTRPTLKFYGPYGADYLSGGSTYPDPVSGNIILSDAPRILEVFSGKTGRRGHFPGMLAIDSQPLRSVSAIAPGTIYTGFPGLTGRAMLMATGSDEFIMKLDEDWGDL